MSENPEPSRMLVNPGIAAAWLAGIPASYVGKRLHGGLVEQHASAMRSGDWELTPDDPILLDKDGVAVDGLVRLLAVIVANVRVWMYVQTDAPRREGLDREAFADLKDFSMPIPAERA